jgi:arginase family enzyme
VASLTCRADPPDGFWIHVDADVFDETIMQSVDDPRPGGLTWDEGITVLRTALASDRAAGLQIAIYNPGIDRDGCKRPRPGRSHTERAGLVGSRQLCDAATKRAAIIHRLLSEGVKARRQAANAKPRS